MRDILYIGATPTDEDCEQVGSNCDYERMKLECSTYMAQLRRVYGEPPKGTSLSIKRESHDFGAYYEVVCNYDPDDEVSSDYAFNVESGCATWDDESKRILLLLNYNLK